MKPIFKKILSAILALALVVSLIPAVFADGVGTAADPLHGTIDPGELQPGRHVLSGTKTDTTWAVHVYYCATQAEASASVKDGSRMSAVYSNYGFKPDGLNDGSYVECWVEDHHDDNANFWYYPCPGHDEPAPEPEPAPTPAPGRPAGVDMSEAVCTVMGEDAYVPHFYSFGQKFTNSDNEECVKGIFYSWDDVQIMNEQSADSMSTESFPQGCAEGWYIMSMGGGFIPCEGHAAPASDFVTSITLKKDYNDSFAEAPAEGEEPTKTTAPKETLTFTIAPVTADAPALPATVTMSVENGAGEAEIAMPTTGLVPGSYWYKLTETEGETAGVTYDDAEYYLHLIVGSKGGVLGVKYATIHTGAPDAETGEWLETDKIDTITNAYGEGSLSISQTVSGNGAEEEDEFTVTVTLTLPVGTEITTDVVLDNGTVITPGMWNEDGTVEIEIPIHGGETVTISGIPDGTTYEVEQTETNEDIGYTAPEYTMEENEDPDATDGETIATGTIGDKLDKVLIENEKNTPVDVGVILENGAYVTMALGTIAAGAFLVISRKKKYEAE